MEWTDEGIVLGARPLGETAVVAELFTRDHGRHLGLVQGGRSRRLRPVLQTGNHVAVRWAARLDAQLGQYTLDLKEAFSVRILDRPLPLLGLESMAALLRYLPERDAHASLFEVTLFVTRYLDDDTVWPALLARWELALLDELGFGLDLTECAATGATADLIYVSPRSGRAVSAKAGAPYKAKLLVLPAFMRGGPANPAAEDIRNGFKLTGYFIAQRIMAPDGGAMPEVRDRLLSRLSR